MALKRGRIPTVSSNLIDEEILKYASNIRQVLCVEDGKCKYKY